MSCPHSREGMLGAYCTRCGQPLDSSNPSTSTLIQRKLAALKPYQLKRKGKPRGRKEVRTVSSTSDSMLRVMRSQQALMLQRLEHVQQSNLHHRLIMPREGHHIREEISDVVDDTYLNQGDSIADFYRCSLLSDPLPPSQLSDRTHGRSSADKTEVEQGEGSSSLAWFWGISDVEKQIHQSTVMKPMFWGNQVEHL